VAHTCQCLVPSSWITYTSLGSLCALAPCCPAGVRYATASAGAANFAVRIPQSRRRLGLSV